MARHEGIVGAAGVNYYNGGGSRYPVRATNGAWYVFLSSINTIVYKKSVDGGRTWGPAVDVKISGMTHVATAIWYDRWSGISGDLIHIVYTDSNSDDVLYRSLDTSSDTLSTETVVFAGATTGTSAGLSIVRARGGNLVVVYDIDGGTERGCARSTDVGATWGAIADCTENAPQDRWFLLPGWGADNQDVICIYHDVSDSELSRKVYDDSADSWAETSIATGLNHVGIVFLPNIAGSVDLANSQNVVVAWTAVDTANADLLCWTVTEAAITALTDVVTNSTDDQGMCAIGIDEDTGYWWVAYGGKSDGSETWTTALNVYCRVSQDGGTTWGPESLRTPMARDREHLCTAVRFRGDFQCLHFADEAIFNADYILMDVAPFVPRASYLMGV